MSEPTPTPCGAWTSPLSSEQIVSQSVQPGDADFCADGGISWQELRPAEKGRSAVLRRRADGGLEEWTPPPFSARTQVHEYGGRAYLELSDGALVFSEATDRRLYRIDPGRAPQPITPATALRYADLQAHPSQPVLVAVREDHRGSGEPANTLVALHPQGDPAGGRVIAGGRDFYAAPRPSPDGTQLAWLCWDHPDMPWDGCELWLADIDADGSLLDPRRVAGSRGESILQPEWSPDGGLHFISDRSGWWNLYRHSAGADEALCPMQAEFGQPMWVFGQSSYAFESARQMVCSYRSQGLSHMALLHLDSLQLEPIDLPFSWIGNLRAAPGQVLFSAGSATLEPSICRLDLQTRDIEVLRRGSATGLDAAFISAPQPITFPSRDGQLAHGFYYPPRNPGQVPAPGEKPPLLVLSHGGPTSAAQPVFKPALQFWTSRGFAVLDVDYGGSSGYGRAYRQRLDGRWGEVDVDDCVAGAQHLVRRGEVDGARLIIRGGSAGGYTTLCALTFRDAFAAGASLYGIGDLEALARDTHKFESRYLERLVGPWPQRADLYRQRSPIHHTERLACPLILLQGAEDRVVPPAQSRAMHAALKAKGVPVAYLEFEGEQHGFRNAANIRRALDAELYFYGRVFGFEPADPIEAVPIDNL